MRVHERERVRVWAFSDVAVDRRGWCPAGFATGPIGRDRMAAGDRHLQRLLTHIAGDAVASVIGMVDRHPASPSGH
jgi:hypothetical protein